MATWKEDIVKALENLGGSTPASPTLFNSAVKAAREELRDVVQKLADHKDLVKTYRKAGIL